MHPRDKYLEWINQVGRKEKNIFMSLDEVHGRYFADDIFNEKSGEVYFESGDEITGEALEKLNALNIKSFYISEIDGLNIGSYLRNTFLPS